MATRDGGKTSVYLPKELAAQLSAWEMTHGDVNLSNLLAEAVRRHIGRLNEDEQQAETVQLLARQVKALQADMRAMRRQVKALERGR